MIYICKTITAEGKEIPFWKLGRIMVDTPNNRAFIQMEGYMTVADMADPAKLVTVLPVPISSISGLPCFGQLKTDIENIVEGTPQFRGGTWKEG